MPLAQWVRRALLAFLATSVLGIGVGIYGAMAGAALQAGAGDAWTSPEMLDDIAGISALVQLVVLIACLILIGRWMYRVNKNAHSLGADMPMSPGWNVGYLFVPFANLWMPYRGVRASWDATAAYIDEQRRAATAIFAAWWGGWIVSNILSQISFRMMMRDDASIDTFITTSWIDAASALAGLVSGVALLTIVPRLSAAQNDAHAPSIFE
ncbi:DUF4328 domain-containing protein [Sphingomonas sp. CJ99]